MSTPLLATPDILRRIDAVLRRGEDPPPYSARRVFDGFAYWLGFRLQIADLERVGGPALAVQRGLRRLLRSLALPIRESCRRMVVDDYDFATITYIILETEPTS